ncbi:type I secretion system permease/ATPase [Aliirhizobium smilacinae]|uniref:Type I secretion system permease/ATPase n=1 Tax=Aliirhizobium smilacinae TaxID=1395944 RepID=A0A5C4XU07_9HYPH|nr:type I secretion system permease/ATPase [Rhizobium smilacinae]
MLKSRHGLIAVGLASALINLLYLTSSLFMLQVYDRVIPSQSIATLVALGLLVAGLYLFQAAFEIIRSRMLTRIGGIFDETIATSVFGAAVKAPIASGRAHDGLTLMRDFDRVRAFLSSTGLPAFFDLPWLPFYIAISFLFHPLIGIVAMTGSFILLLFAYLTHASAQKSSPVIAGVTIERDKLLGAAHRNSDVVEAMGMRADLASAWSRINDRHRSLLRNRSDTANAYATASKIFRIALQSFVLAVGAVLVIENKASGGIIIAASILLSRALAPAEQAIANWQGFVLCRQSLARLRQTLADDADHVAPMALPLPKAALVVENLSSAPPGQSGSVITNVSFSLKSGDALAVIGPSASGKSSLARALTGIWPIARGSFRLDGATLDRWSEAERKNIIGYLPQDIELFDGTIAQNVARFRADADAGAIVEAAKIADVHELILRLPDGYESEIGPGGSMLSAGQRQRIALARAVFGNPFLVVLDEPNSNLDADGEIALTKTILSIRNSGAIAIIIAHRPSALTGVDQVLLMVEGRVAAFGAKSDVLPKILRKNQQGELRSSPLAVVGEAGE